MEEEELAERLRRWEESGGEVRVADLSETRATVELCTCTGELMETITTGEPAVIDLLVTRASS